MGLGVRWRVSCSNITPHYSKNEALTTAAAAIACNLAAGMSMQKAVKKANIYVAAGIKLSKDLGKGSGPINHFHSTYTLPFPP